MDSLPNRQTHRFSEYDYSLNGAYFVTIVCEDRINRFGEIANGSIELNDAGTMVKSVWDDLPNRFPMMELGPFVIMPNHIHGIIVLNAGDISNAGEQSNAGEHKVRPYGHVGIHDHLNAGEYIHPNGTSPNSIGRIIQAFKSITTNRYGNGVKMGLVPPFQNEYGNEIIGIELFVMKMSTMQSGNTSSIIPKRGRETDSVVMTSLSEKTL